MNDSASSGFVGNWLTTFGELSLTARGTSIVGAYRYRNTEGRIAGTVSGDTLKFTYREPNEQGEGVFRLLRTGKFSGSYVISGDSRARRWDGERGFDGIWESNFGRVRLIHEADRIHGYYEGAGPAVIDGQLRDGGLEFRFRESNSIGEGRLRITDDGGAFDGEPLC